MWRPRGLEAEKTGAGEQCLLKILMPPKSPKILIGQCSMFYCSGKSSWNCHLLPLPKVGRRPLSGGSTFQVAAKPAWSPNVSEHIKYSQGYLQQHLPWFKNIYTYLQCNLIPVIQDKLNVIFTMKNIEYLYICVYTTKNIDYLLYMLCIFCPFGFV